MQINKFNNQSATISMNQHKKDAVDDLGKVSSGKSIDLDDASLSVIANALMSDVLVDSQGVMNANMAVGMMQIADGVLSNITQMGSRLQELSTASNNAALSNTQKDALNSEFNMTIDAINSSVDSASFNGKKIFDSSINFLLGSDDISINIENINTKELDIDSKEGIDNFTQSLNRLTGELGSSVNSVESSVNSMINSIVQKSAARSQIADTDMAKHIGSFEQSEMKLDISLIVQAHNKNLSYERVHNLLK